MSPGNVRKLCKGRLTIPPALVSQAGMKDGDLIEVTVSGMQLILRAVGYEEPKKREGE